MRYDDSKRGLYSAFLEYSDKEIERTLSTKFKLSNDKVRGAMEFYKRLRDGTKLELALFFDEEEAFVRSPGQDGMHFVKGLGLSTNEEWIQFERFIEDNPTQVSEAIGKEGYLHLPYRSRDFNSDPRHAGTIVIDGTGKESRAEQVINIFEHALKELSK